MAQEKRRLAGWRGGGAPRTRGNRAPLLRPLRLRAALGRGGRWGPSAVAMSPGAEPFTRLHSAENSIALGPQVARQTPGGLTDLLSLA